MPLGESGQIRLQPVVAGQCSTLGGCPRPAFAGAWLGASLRRFWVAGISGSSAVQFW